MNRTHTLRWTRRSRSGAAILEIRGRKSSTKWAQCLCSNAIKADHQRYLALDGRGFLLGDGALNYGHENILEAYYNAHVWRGLFGAFDLLHFNNPGI
jgi:high affinity Mn2+ porin